MRTYNPEDQYKDLTKLSNRIYKNVKANQKPVQLKLTPHTKIIKEKKKYTQDWPIYEKAMSEEKLMFLRLLKDAVEHLMLDYNYQGNGRPPMHLADVLKCLCIKSYNNYSSWRTHSELRIAQAMGVIEEIPRRSTINKYMQSPTVTKLLHKLYKTIAEPLAQVELYFSIDATGISNKYGNMRWMKLRHTKEEHKKKKEYSKLNIITGNKTNIICSANITKGTSHESPYLKTLLDDTCKKFSVKELSADAGYLSRKNVQAVSDAGVAPYIMPTRNVNVPMKGTLTPWNSMLRLWKCHQMTFAQHYHRRSNVETTFSMIKKKFGDFCRTKKTVSQENEILSRIVCHNTVVLAEALLTYDLREGFIAT